MLNHWNCESCKSYNDILNAYCMICKAYKPDWVTGEYQARIEIIRDIWFHRIELDSNGEQSMTDQEQLFAKYYNGEKVLVKDMEDIQLQEYRDELRTIAFEAKARAVAADDELRERKAKKGNKEWLLTPTEHDVSVSDAMNAVKTRTVRMSKMDKMKQQLLAAGIDEETVKEMVRNLELKATDKNVKTITFEKQTTEMTAVQVKIKPNGDATPFDPSNLSFNK